MKSLSCNVPSDSNYNTLNIDSSTYTQTFKENTYLSNKNYRHRHNSKCFITEIFIYGVKFCLKKKSIDFDNDWSAESILSTDDGYAGESDSSGIWSIGSDRTLPRSSATSSEGCQEIDQPIRRLSQSDKILNSICLNLRSSLCNDCISLPRLSNSFYKSLENILLYFQDKYHSSNLLENAGSLLNNSELSNNENDLYRIYKAIFSDRINWGRIVVMIGFVGELCVSAMNYNRFELMEEYVAMSVSYVHEHLMDWIVAHGGWEGLVDFQTGQSSDSIDLENLLGSVGVVLKVASIALAGAVIFKFVADHI